MNSQFSLRPRAATLALSLTLFLLMPSFFYSNLSCRMVADVSECGWQFTYYLSGVASLLSLREQLSFRWRPSTQIQVSRILIGIGLNMLLAYGLAAWILSRVPSGHFSPQSLYTLLTGRARYAVPLVLLLVWIVLGRFTINASRTVDRQFPDLDIATAANPLRFVPSTLTREVIAIHWDTWLPFQTPQWYTFIRNDNTEQAHRWVLVSDDIRSMADILAAVGDDPKRHESPGSPILAMSSLLHGGMTQMLAVPIPSPGQYRYLCVVPGHAAAGMEGRLIITERPPTAEELAAYQSIRRLWFLLGVETLLLVGSVLWWRRRLW
jgi:hypothetical protein